MDWPGPFLLLKCRGGDHSALNSKVIGNMKTTFWIALLTALTFAVTGCSSSALKSRNKLDESSLSKFGRKKELDEIKDGTMEPESIYDAGGESFLSFGDEGGILSGLRGGGGGGSQQSVRANMLFAGALDVVMGLPIQVASREGGFIATEWKVDPKDPGSRYRLNIRVNGRDPYGEVKVAVLKQSLVNGDWVDQPADVAAARHISKKIRKLAQVARP